MKQPRKRDRTASSRRAPGAAGSDRRLTLLIVDDEREILEILERLFARDYKVVVAAGGKEGLKQFRKHRPELVLSDQRMRDMTGIEMLKEIQRDEPGTGRLLITGYSDIDAVIEAVNCRLLERYVTKPWDDDELLLAVREAAQRYLRDAGARGPGSIYF